MLERAVAQSKVQTVAPSNIPTDQILGRAVVQSQIIPTHANKRLMLTTNKQNKKFKTTKRKITNNHDCDHCTHKRARTPPQQNSPYDDLSPAFEIEESD